VRKSPVCLIAIGKRHVKILLLILKLHPEICKCKHIFTIKNKDRNLLTSKNATHRPFPHARTNTANAKNCNERKSLFPLSFCQLGVQSTIFYIISAETTAANYQRFEPNSSIRILFHLKIPREERIGACKNFSAFHI
jgi:hypothetical protein